MIQDSQVILSLGVGRKNVDVVRGHPLGFVAVGNHLTSRGIELGMSGVRQAVETATEGVVIVDGVERERVHGHRRTIFFQREQKTVVIDDVRVGRAAADSFHAGIIGERIAVHAEQPLASGGLRLEALRPRIAALEIHVAVLDAEHADVAFAVEGNVASHRRVLPIGSDAIEGAVNAGGNFALDVAVANVNFRAERTAAAHPRSVGGKMNGFRVRRRREGRKSTRDGAGARRCRERTHETAATYRRRARGLRRLLRLFSHTSS